MLLNELTDLRVWGAERGGSFSFESRFGGLDNEP